MKYNNKTIKNMKNTKYMNKKKHFKKSFRGGSSTTIDVQLPNPVNIIQNKEQQLLNNLLAIKGTISTTMYLKKIGNLQNVINNPIVKQKLQDEEDAAKEQVKGAAEKEVFAAVNAIPGANDVISVGATVANADKTFNEFGNDAEVINAALQPYSQPQNGGGVDEMITFINNAKYLASQKMQGINKTIYSLNPNNNNTNTRKRFKQTKHF